jgi:hypothetical protein
VIGTPRYTLLICTAALALLPPVCRAQAIKGKVEKPQLAPIFSPAVDKAPIMLQPKQSLAQPRNENAALNLTQPGLDSTNTPAINCRLPVKQIGSIALNDAFATITDNFIEVQYNNPADPEPLLTGKVIRLDDTGTTFGANRQMSGLVVFQSGQMLGRLLESPAASSDNFGTGVAASQSVLPGDEMIFSRDGSMTGQIVGIDKANLILKDRAAMRTVSLDAVTYVRSPRAFVFTLSGRPSRDNMRRTEVQSVAFQPTLSSVALNDEVIVGQPAESIFGDDEPPLGEPVPASITRMRQLQRGNYGPRPFAPWP